ncbi:MAG: response regulator [Elusimicrobia bacterium]|nr:response regulator [Elusimicrobiota bacterium]
MLSKFFKKPRIILVIEDEEAVASTLEIALNAKGYKTIKTASGHEGTNLAMKNSPALVILDIRLPDIDGWQVLNNLRATESTKNIPVLILTQLNQMGDINMGFNLGATAYLAKPLDLSKLYKKVSEILGD